MRSLTSQLPAVQFITLPPDLEEPYNQEIFQEVVVMIRDTSQEERHLLEAGFSPPNRGRRPEWPSLFSLGASRLSPETGFSFTFKFKE